LLDHAFVVGFGQGITPQNTGIVDQYVDLPIANRRR